MELPTRFYKGVTSYWRERKYQKLDGSASTKKIMRVARLGDGRRSRRRFFKLKPIFRVKVAILSPVRLLARLRDAYINCMQRLAARGNGLVAPSKPEALLARRFSKARQVRLRQAEFDQRVMFEIYKSLVDPLSLRD